MHISNISCKVNHINTNLFNQSRPVYKQQRYKFLFLSGLNKA